MDAILISAKAKGRGGTKHVDNDGDNGDWLGMMMMGRVLIEVLDSRSE